MTSKIEQVKVASLRKHPDYIRGTVKASAVSEYIETMRDLGTAWFGPPAVLQPIPADHADRKEGGEYWMLDGNNRIAAAVECGLISVPSIVRSGLAPAEAIAEQIRENANRGLRLTAEQQTAAILKMHSLGMKQQAIADKSGIHQSSVNRIIKGKQRADGGKSTTAAGGSTADKKKTAKPFDVENWFKGLSRLMKGWETKGTKIRKFGDKMEMPEKLYKAFDTISEAITPAEKESTE